MNLFSFQKGMTLVELMIAMTIGLVISMAALSLLSSSNLHSSLTSSVVQSQEAGRFASNVLNRALMKAGYDPDEIGALAFADLCADPDNPAMCTLDTSSGSGDRLAIVRTAEPNNPLSCFGTLLIDPETGSTIDSNRLVTDIYWVEENADQNLSSLVCQTYDYETATALTDSQALIAGIEAMHILYGQSTTDLTSGKRNVSHYLPATGLNNRTANSNEKDWDNVYAVRIALLASAFDSTYGVNVSKNYILLDAQPYQFNDNIQRQIYSLTTARTNL